MATVLTPSERRVAWLLVAGILLGLLWHTFEGLRPPPPPLLFQGTGPSADTLSTPVLHEPSGARVSEETPPPFPVDLNRAGVAELVALPGVGPVLAGRIVTWREENGRIDSPEDLLEVSGIGPATLARIRNLVSVAPEPQPPPAARRLETWLDGF